MFTGRGKNLTSKEAARLLGVSEASVKRWADVGLLPTARTAGGHRRFRPEDVALFKRKGFGETRAVKRPPTRVACGTAADAASPLDGAEALVEETFRLLLDGDAEELSALLIKLHLHGHTVASVADRVLCPPMRRIGDLWHQGELTIAQEHVATCTAMSALRNLQSVLELMEERRRLALCCSTEDDFHQFPVQLAALTLEEHGLGVLNIGVSTPFFALAEAVERFCPRLICIASTMLLNLEHAAREYADFQTVARRVGALVVLGGAGFADAQMRSRFPADLHAESFTELKEFLAARFG